MGEIFVSVLGDLVSFLGSIYKESKEIYNIIGIILSILIVHKAFYSALGLLFTRKFKHTNNKHKYAILIAARNEKNVIGNLIDSIHKQDYDNKMLTIFVVADNCTDNTAEIARSKGAICYERFDEEHKTKGFALQYLLNKIEEDYGRMSFEGYFIFDADNLLKKDFISRMNDSFDAGEKIITSYRNTKNFDENWIASTYALHWLRSIRTNHRARSILRLATNIQGTGFLFASEIVRNGWKYTSLTEDRALTADAVAQGYRITYNDEAEFYDEQPVSLKVAFRQRLRWSKGHLMAFAESGPKLFVNIFFGKTFVKNKWNKEEQKKKSFFSNLLESIRHRFASYDTLIQLTPIVVINIIRWLIVGVIIYSCYCYNNGITNLDFFTGGTYLARTIKLFGNIKVNIEPGWSAFGLSIILTIWWRIFYRIGKYFENIFIAVYIFLVENARIKKMSIWKKMLYCFTWPTFDIIGRYTIYFALFMKVTWKPIPHESKITIDDISEGKVEI